jgi:protein kinase-like protein
VPAIIAEGLDVGANFAHERRVVRAGERFDRYVIEALLGRGGMGEVYRAYDERLRRRVALKLLHAGGDPAGPGAMLREARAAAALHHPNAVAVYDVAEADGRAYLTMELLQGRPLRALINAEGVPNGARLRWLRQVAAVLAEAHRLGIVHRDVKPENIFVCDDGVLKLLDFGIARVAQAEGPPTLGRPAAPGLGRPAAPARWGQSDFVGTPLYMAPEHRLGGRADARSDQYAWGLVAFELFTGMYPRTFESEPRERLVEALLARGLAPPIAEVITRAFLLMPETRFGSMAELIFAWDAALAAPPSDAPTTGPAAPPGLRASPHAAPPGPPAPPHAAPLGLPAPPHAAPSGSPAHAAAQAFAAERSEAPGLASGPQNPTWRRKFGRSASDAELAVLVAGLFVTLGLGATFVAHKVKERRAAAAGAAGAAKPWACAAEGPELTIAEGVLEGPATSLLTHGGQVYAHAEVAGGPKGGPVGRTARLVEGRWQPLEDALPPWGRALSSRGAFTTLEDRPALLLRNEQAFFVGAIELAPGALPIFSMSVPGHSIDSFGVGESSRATAVVTLGRAKNDGGPAGKLTIIRPGCRLQSIDLKVERPSLEPGAPPHEARLAPPLVAMADGKIAIALPRDDATAALSIVEYDPECDMARFGARSTAPLSPRSALAFHRGELYWATAAGGAIEVGGPGGRPAVSVRGRAPAGDLALAAGDEALALAWIEGAGDAGRLSVAGVRPGDARVSPLALAEGGGLRDVHVRALPGGAFVTWVKGASMRGRALRCGPR